MHTRVDADKCSGNACASDLCARLVGRVNELHQITQLIDGVSERGHLIVVEGEAGIGKTTILDLAAALAAQKGMKVLSGSAKELEREVSFAALASCLSAHRWHPSSAYQNANRLSDAGPRQIVDNRHMTVADAIVQFFRRLSIDNPLLVTIDDAHWADEASLLALERLGEAVTKLPLLVLVAARPLSRTMSLSKRLRRPDSLTIPLTALSDPGVALLAEHVIGNRPGPGLTSRLAAAGGNPLYVIELLAAMQTTGAITVAGGVADLVTANAPTTGDLLPASLHDAILRRLDCVPSSVQRVLSIAAALGHAVEVGSLAVVLDASVIDMWDVVETAVEAELLVRHSDDIVFRHDLIREALAAQVPASTRSTLHLRMAQRLMVTSAPVEQVASHLLHGDCAMGRGNLLWLTRVAGMLTVRSPELAVELLERALSDPKLDPPVRDILQLHYIKALLWIGRTHQAEAAAHTALAFGKVENDQAQNVMALKWLLAQAYFGRGQLHNAVDVAEAALAQCDPDIVEAGRLHGVRALCYFFLEEFDRSEHAAAAASAIGRGHSDPAALGWALRARGSVLYARSRFDDALQLTDQAMEIYEAGIRTGRSSELDPYVLRSCCLIELDRHDDADAAVDLAVRHSERFHEAYLGPSLFQKARLCFLNGRWDDAVAAIDACRSTPNWLGFRAITDSLAALIAVHRGDLMADPETLADTDDQLASRMFRAMRPWAQALIHETRGIADKALAMLSETCRGSGSGLSAPTIYWLYPDLARLAAADRDDDLTAEVAAVAETAVAEARTPSRLGTALLCRGLADNRCELLAEAADAFRRAGRPLYEGMAHENLAASLARENRSEEARTALASAVQRYTGLGATWDAARAKARLRAFDVRMNHSGSGNRSKKGWQALTPTERRIASMIADGCTNSDIALQMFLSRRTVQTHVSNVLRKLELQSRVQIALTHSREA